jgi:hypothetical protein
VILAQGHVRDDVIQARAAVFQTWSALRYVSAEIQRVCPDIVRSAVEQSGMALEFVPAEIQRLHPELVRVAVEQTGLAIVFVLFPTPELCTLAVLQNPFARFVVPGRRLHIVDGYVHEDDEGGIGRMIGFDAATR